MPGRSWRTVVMLCATVAVAGVIVPGAAADGLPVLGIDVGSEGVAATAGAVRYVTLPSARDTIVAQTATVGGRILGFTRLRGKFTIPAVAYDGSASGLSADGATLVLIRPRRAFPRVRTTFAVVDALPLRVRKILVLPGDYSFDAISPDGGTMFLIEYVSATDPTRYHVRSYSLRSLRLLPRPVVDPRESSDAMRGSPISRATSPDGRWAYTLYDGAGGTPFVHALDALRREARCVDLPLLAGRQDLWQLRLSTSLGGRSLAVSTSGRALAFVDTTSFRVSPPASPGQTATRHAGRPWRPAAVAALATLLVAVALSLAVKRRRRRYGVTESLT